MKKKILLIDDSVTIHRVIDLCVDKDKFNVFKVFSREEAVMKLKSDTPDLILLDNKLANIRASEMVAVVREYCPECWVVLLVGAFDQFEDSQCAEAGADDYIFKPFDSEALEEKIATGLASERKVTAAAPVEEVVEELELPDDIELEEEVADVTDEEHEVQDMELPD